MEATLTIPAAKLSEEAARLILRRASEWGTTPAEAVERMLDQMAARAARSAKQQRTRRGA